MKILFLFFMIQTLSIAQASELSRRVELLEVDRALNIFSFSGRLDTQYFKIKNIQDEKLDLYRLRSSLNVNAAISPRLRFYSRFTMSKYFNTYTQQNPSPYATTRESVVASSLYEDANLVLERAYFDYFLKIPMTISVGRLPTFGGEPLNFYDNLPAQSTYPIMAYNAELDGISLTYDFYKILPKNHQALLRSVYTPISHLNYDNGHYPLSLPHGEDGGKVTSSAISTIAAEYAITNRKNILDDWRLKVFYSRLQGLSFADVILPALPHANPPVFTATPFIEFPNKMLNINFFSIHNKFTNLAKLGFDLHASFFFSSVENRKLAVITNPSPLPAIPPLGIRSDTLGTTRGKSMLINLKKKIPFSFLNRPSLGVEYLKSDGKFFSPTLLGSSEDASEFYNTMGSAWHMYYLQPFEDELSLRLGYRIQNIDHKSDSNKRSLGATIPANENISSYYLSLLLYF